MKKGKFLTFNIAGRKEDISGVVLDYNADWVLIRRCFDYRLDGYTLFKNSKKLSWDYDVYEKMATTILKKKLYHFKEEELAPVSTIDTALAWIANRYPLIQLDTAKGDASDVLKFIKKEGHLYLFQELTIEGKWRYKLELPEKEVAFISFGNDYLNSLSLIL